MKTINLFVGIFIALFIMSACSSDDSNTNNENSLIIGVWSKDMYKASDFNNQNWYNLTERTTHEFQANGAFIYRYDDVVDANGTWSISGNILTMNWEDESIQSEILILNETTLQTKETFDDGEWEIYKYTKE